MANFLEELYYGNVDPQARFLRLVKEHAERE